MRQLFLNHIERHYQIMQPVDLFTVSVLLERGVARDLKLTFPTLPPQTEPTVAFLRERSKPIIESG